MPKKNSPKTENRWSALLFSKILMIWVLNCYEFLSTLFMWCFICRMTNIPLEQTKIDNSNGCNTRISIVTMTICLDCFNTKLIFHCRKKNSKTNVYFSSEKIRGKFPDFLVKQFFFVCFCLKVIWNLIKYNFLCVCVCGESGTIHFKMLNGIIPIRSVRFFSAARVREKKRKKERRKINE